MAEKAQVDHSYSTEARELYTTEERFMREAYAQCDKKYRDIVDYQTFRKTPGAIAFLNAFRKLSIQHRTYSL